MCCAAFVSYIWCQVVRLWGLKTVLHGFIVTGWGILVFDKCGGSEEEEVSWTVSFLSKLSSSYACQLPGGAGVLRCVSPPLAPRVLAFFLELCVEEPPLWEMSAPFWRQLPDRRVLIVFILRYLAVSLFQTISMPLNSVGSFFIICVYVAVM